MAFLRNNNRFILNSGGNIETFDKLPPGNYVVKYDPLSSSFFVEPVDSFTIPKRVYCNLQPMAKRILNTYSKREQSTGVLLSGEKGSGKSLLGKLISSQAATCGNPTILVNSPFFGEPFNQFIQGVVQDCVVFFDEFEKVYDEREKQEQLLTLLDGVFSSKKLFLFTCNNKFRVNEHMNNRPGRIFYNIEFESLESVFIEEYCQENLADQSQLDGLLRLVSLYEKFNFDMLKALVEEMNRYSESAIQAIGMLNAKPTFAERREYAIELTVDGVTPAGRVQGTSHLDPLGTPSVEISIEEEDGDYANHTFLLSDIKHIDGNTGTYVYESGNKRLVLRRIESSRFDVRTFCHPDVGYAN